MIKAANPNKHYRSRVRRSYPPHLFRVYLREYEYAEALAGTGARTIG